MPVLEVLVETKKEKKKEKHIKIYNHLKAKIRALVASEVKLREAVSELPADSK
jgi:hypothetical protein